MVGEADLPVKFEHPVLKSADARDESGLVSFKLVDALTVGFREGVERLEQFRLTIAERLLEVIELMVHLGPQDRKILFRQCFLTVVHNWYCNGKLSYLVFTRPRSHCTEDFRTAPIGRTNRQQASDAD